METYHRVSFLNCLKRQNGIKYGKDVGDKEKTEYFS